jgi:cytochrome oxidase Cu insertion factor (SCO1/SenC/PrrC family)
LFLVFALGRSHSQNIVIKGKAHSSYAGKVIKAFTITDNITGINQREDQDTIGTDGYFELAMQSEDTRPVFLRIDNVVAKLYVQPDFVYGVTIPELDQNMNYNNDTDLNVNIGIIGNDSTELNALIFDYEGKFNDLFGADDSRFLSRPVMFKRADSLKKICDKRYEKISNAYFKTYVEYSIAAINASVSRGENYLINGYILNKPIQYRHHDYMQFFNTCFSGYVKAVASTRKGQSLFNIINVKQDYNALVAFLKEDKFLKNDSIRELVIIKNLWDFYFSPDFDQAAVKNMVSQLNVQTANKEHKRITSTMLAYFNKMQPGSLAPGFSARTKDGTMGTLASYKGRWVYLNFFSTTNTESLKEMPKIMALKKKFGDKVSFISICVDDSLKSYKEYLRTNPKQDWAIWFNDEQSLSKTAKDNYFVTGSEAYFLVNNFGYLAQSPALSPSKGIENKFNLLFKSGKKKTKTGIR